ncbi:hypothetical protein HZS_857 [Henneguya salminicola]|nr:hypothetical protein HZS_857 [Henneguya salminicola]
MFDQTSVINEHVLQTNMRKSNGTELYSRYHSAKLNLENDKIQTLTDNIKTNSSQQISLQSKERNKLKKTITPMIILLGFFLLTWTPFILLRWVRIFNEEINPYILRTSHLLFMIYQI